MSTADHLRKLAEYADREAAAARKEKADADAKAMEQWAAQLRTNADKPRNQ